MREVLGSDDDGGGLVCTLVIGVLVEMIVRSAVAG